MTLVGSAVMLWLESGRRSLLEHGAGIAVVFLAGTAYGALDAILTFALHVVYPRWSRPSPQPLWAWTRSVTSTSPE